MSMPKEESAAAIPFIKMHGLGNDYVYLDEREVVIDDAPRWARWLADRHRGIGGDGLIILRADREHACRMEMYNADGSRAEMCGNGIRCVARLAHERGYARANPFTIATDAGVRQVEIRGAAGADTSVRVSMGIPCIEALRATLEAGGRTFTGTILSVGNPHFVVELDQPPAEFPVELFGPMLESHARFPKRCNIEFVYRRAPDRLDFRVWERGSGETQACGTGATAAAAALHALGRLTARSTVHLLGGDLEIEIAPDGSAWMTGPATESFRGTFPRSLLG